MTLSLQTPNYRRLGEALVDDLDLSKRRHSQGEPAFDGFCSALVAARNNLRIVYTAFDGDHFQLCKYMRACALSRGYVPANPESILGYKDTVSARLTKRGVLLDDLAILRNCDELWIVTECPADPSSVLALAEGVVVELLFFLKRRVGATVQFVSPLSLLKGQKTELVPYNFSYEETKAALHPDQAGGILELANSGLTIDKQLPQLVYHIHDVLDFKYAHWLRPKAYDDDMAPLVPGLAVELGDMDAGLENLGFIFAAWATLTKLATKAWLLPPMDEGRRPSLVAKTLECVWLRTRGPGTLSGRPWATYPIPKARAGTRWPLTKYEGGVK